ncbi:hypothetical protein DOTSEDRAFT_71738 [Dothistroma septosporum NZE10]|uniref:Uncharacterized protein n=1 Tax=Dothistroma septosporum (strain NZE10 / CBS 128990) TaxID=675120 RepID=N1PNS0_DOTSN|nr:hypothetical protein DOTSEDRAFT_71738 [Dothistroma septosporum NZE10]
MFPSQLHYSLRRRSLSTGSIDVVRASTNSILRGGVASSQTRSFWGWRRPDYSSHIDPMFHRFTRYRTLKTRAKLLDKLRRKGRWNWDAEQRPFFSPKQVRLAHHIGRPRWRCSEDGKEEKIKDDAEEDSHELSKREKEWKEQMESMRKRIEQDPYEAVFGRRFEPFWSPLVPSWMREEMGLTRWPKPKETPMEKSPNGQLTNYSYSSSTSWDSWTKRARKEEWDSISGETRRYEYDPISNRMVAITSPKSGEPQVKTIVNPTGPASTSSEPRSEGSMATLITQLQKTQSNEKPTASKPADTRSSTPVPTQTTPAPNQKTPVYFPSLINTAVATKTAKASAVATLPKNELDSLTAAEVRASVGKAKQTTMAEEKQQDRAYRHGKLDLKRSPWDQAETRVMLEKELDSIHNKKEALLQHENGLFHIEKQKRDLAKLEEKSVAVIKQLKSLDAIEAKLAAGMPRDAFIFDKANKTAGLETSLSRTRASFEKALAKETSRSLQNSLQPSLERMQSKQLSLVDELDDSAAHESTGEPVNYKTANIPRDWEKQVDLLQTNRVQRTRGTSVNTRQTNLASELNARNAAKSIVDDVIKAKRSGARWIDIMNAKRAAWEAQQAEKKAAVESRDADKNARLEKANTVLEFEVKEQKFRMQAHEDRYAHKIRSLRKELDTAYKQSSVQGDMHTERIRGLEQALGKAQKAAGETSKIEKLQTERERYQQKIRDLRSELDVAFKQSTVTSENHVERIKFLEAELEKALNGRTDTLANEKQRYKDKVKSLREELDRTFKQSSAQGDKHVERIRELEEELEQARNPSLAKAVEVTQAEGDFSANVAKYATKNYKWYKQPHYQSQTTPEPISSRSGKAVQSQRDQMLVREVREIYENRYGKIDINHRQQSTSTLQKDAPQAQQVVEVESGVDLGKALADYEHEQRYGYRKDNLEAEIAAQERGAHEAQALMAPESSSKMKQVIGHKLGHDQDSHGARIVDGAAPRLIPIEVATHSKQEATSPKDRELESFNITWEEPPIYKVLAYDSGNDMFSTATTSSNFTGNEHPISIPEALSQLYQPARFVPRFSELQRDGYQVIHGTKDLLVFKKVKSPAVTPALVDHGLVKPVTGDVFTNAVPNTAIIPVDGMTRTIEPEIGSFASPTGFVGDRWDTAVAEQAAASTIPNPEKDILEQSLKAYETSNYPRIKREERVFSGSRLNKRERRRHHHEPTSEQVNEYKKKWKSYRSRMRWALGVGIGASCVAYGLGAATERKERKERERWEEILEGRKSRWW